MTMKKSSDCSIDDMILAYLNESLADPEQADLIAMLKADPEHIRRFADVLLFEDQLRTAVSTALQCASLADFTNAQLDATPDASSWRRFITKWQTITVAVACLAVGLVGSSVVFGYVAPSPSKAIFAIRDGFEEGPAPLSQGPPSIAGVWSGDYGEVTGRKRGLKPAEGQSMYRFLRSDFDGKPNPGNSFFSDLFRVVDLRPIRASGGEGLLSVQVSAAFNTPADRSRQPVGAAVSVFAISGELLAEGLPFDAGMIADRALAMSRQCRPRLDSDAGSWERIRTELQVPDEADFLIVHLGATVDHESGPFLDFGDHFVDDVEVEIFRTAGRGKRSFYRHGTTR